MSKYQQDPRFKVTSPLPEGTLFLVGLEGREGVSQLFEFQLRLAADLDADVPFDQILGQSISVECSFYEGKPRYFCGFAAGISWDASDDELNYYTIDLVPELWLLQKNVQCQVFQDKTVPEILKATLGSRNIDYVLNAKYPKHNYCVQYRESDFAFACRLMEEEGIYYFFLHSASGCRMVIADSHAQKPHCPHESTIPFDDTAGGLRDGARVKFWRMWQGVAPSRHTLWDHSFQLTGKNLAADAPIQKSVAVGTKSLALSLAANANLHVFDYPGGYAQRFDGVGYNGQSQASELEHLQHDNSRTVHLRMAEQAAASIRMEGVSDSPFLTSGHTFNLQWHPVADGDYLLTSIEHSFALPGYRGGITEDKPYRNEFNCIPIGLRFVPPRVTPVPRIHGMQTASVIGPEGEEIFTDKHGRVQVQFQWQGTGESSCWIRVGQAWAGSQWGGIFIPRVGQEVIVSFLEGDPDAPIITGNVYNSQQLPPFELPEHKSRMAIKSRSTPDGDSTTFSGLCFEDSKGSEHVQLHSERDMTHQTENNHYVNTGNSYYHRIQSTNLKHTGSIPSAGGGGSGGGGSGESGGDTYHGPFDWSDGSDIHASMGADISLTLGLEISSCTGLDTAANIGACVDFYINPLNLLGELHAVQEVLAGPVGALAGILTGAHTLIIFGNSANVHYGTKFNIQHGSHLDITGWNESTKTMTIVAAGLTAACITAAVIEGGALEDYPDALEGALTVTGVLGAAATGVLTLCENLSFEAANASAAEKKAADLQALATAAAKIAAPAVASLEKQAAAALASAAVSATNAAQSAANAAASATGAAGSATASASSASSAAASAQVPNRVHLVNGNYELTGAGGDVTVQSNYVATNILPAGGNVNMFATGEGVINGVATIRGSNSVVITGGSAGIGLSEEPVTVGQVKISSGLSPDSSISIRRGVAGRQILVNAEGITVDGTAEETPGIVTIKTATGALTISLNPTTNMITIQAPNVTVKAETELQLQAATIGITATTALNIKAPTIQATAATILTLESEDTSVKLEPAGITESALTKSSNIETSISESTLAKTVTATGSLTTTSAMNTSSP